MTGLVFDQWVFGTSPGGTRLHAIKRNACGPDHPLGPHIFTMNSLCNASGSNGFNASNVIFDPSAPYATECSWKVVCTDCSRRWTARHAPQVEGWTKTCRSCKSDKPMGQFHVDRRTKDRLSTTCLDCDEAVKQAIRAAERIADSEAQRHRALASSNEHHLDRLRALTCYQVCAFLPTFTCTRGHTLTPVPGAGQPSGRWEDTTFPTEAWSCACGTREVDVDWSAVYDGVRAAEKIAAATLPDPVPVAA